MTPRRPFRGFDPEEDGSIQIPESLITDLLFRISDVDELRLILYCLWRFQRMDTKFPYVRLEGILEDQDFMDSLVSPEKPQAALQKAINLAVADHALIAAQDERATYLFLNSPRGRRAAQAVGQGAWKPAESQELPPEFSRERVNIFELYETHIGPLTPFLADALRDAEETYPHPWIEDAFRISVEMNKRSWKYIEAILKRWLEEGRDDRGDRESSETDYRKYSKGKYSDFIEH